MTRGWCPICESESIFSSDDMWLRDHYKCDSCGSLPRERALMHVLQRHYPNWRELDIHESSPVQRGVSVKLRQQCPNYAVSQYDASLGFGRIHPSLGYQSQDLEKQTFPDQMFDLVITQDVMEHIFDADAAFREIDRTLKEGGAHIFTTPLVNKHAPTACRARQMPDGNIEFLAPAEYHGDPMSSEGCLVTWHWGFDIVDEIAGAGAGTASILSVADQTMGIEGEYLEVIVQRKAAIS
jgi:SAM-dependent methyltransferase